MKLIKAVEIAYFRSFYKEKLSDLNDLNVVFGRNDSGKSNILRALNLFFNQQTNPSTDFDFSMDFNRKRLSSAAEGENLRKFIYIKVTFTTPPNYRSSLGDEFSVKRQWNISGGQSFHQEISRNVPLTRHQYVTRLLNQIHFHYIPAVKDRRIFSWLFQKIYSIIVGNVDFSKALDRFSTEIQSNTNQLFADLEPILGFRSALAPPKNLTELFAALDVDTRGGDDIGALSLILQRGDGLQVRHIPEILKFISDHDDKQFHVWGFEEPENSLELAFAFDEARRFIEIAKSNNKQLFITSHSPAFFLINRSEATKFFVSRDDQLSHVREVAGNDERESLELMGDNFYLPLISSSLKTSLDEAKKLTEDIDSLRQELSHVDGPILFVEGVTDKTILEIAYEKLFPEVAIPFMIEPAGGTSKMKALCADGPILNLTGNHRKIFVLVDNDFDGRELARVSHSGRWTKGRNGIMWWLLKPSTAYSNRMAEIGFKPEMYYFCIEDCFSVDLRQAAETEIPEIAADYKYNAQRNYPIKIDHPKLIGAISSNPEFRFFLNGPSKTAKGEFAEWLKQQSVDEFEIFRDFFVNLEGQLNEE